ncbi:MAG: single-stranded DNA-binding protein, partial [Tissierellia bacterium]|nr:single-stranded DNA-binding protein [Tissierellia bacterium]
MKLNKGDMIKTSLSDNTMVIDVDRVKDQAVLFDGNKFAIVGGIAYNEKENKITWEGAKYADDLNNVSVAKSQDLKGMKELLSVLMNNNYKEFVKSLVSIEMQIEDETILNETYDRFMDDSEAGLIDERFNYYIDEMEQDKSKDLSNEKDNEERKDTKTSRNEVEEVEHDSIKGNVVGDPKISTHTAKDGREFSVAAFSVADNDKDGNTKFIQCYAYDNKIPKVENLKKGDFISLVGKMQQSKGKNGKTFENFKIYGVKVLKEKEQNKDKVKSSAIGKLKQFKNKSNKQEQSKGNKNNTLER